MRGETKDVGELIFRFVRNTQLLAAPWASALARAYSTLELRHLSQIGFER